jgi:hypothetical protein
MTTPGPPVTAGKPGGHLANERTFLAWIRTSISIIVFSFVVAKFGITLRELLRVSGNAAHESGKVVYNRPWIYGDGNFYGAGVGISLQNHDASPGCWRFQTCGDNRNGPLLAALFGTILAAYLIYTARTL